MTPTAAALDLVKLSKVFKNDVFKKPQRALDQLTARFPAGRCTGLLGHNGAGKTTTIRMILGLIKPDHGHVELDGKPIDLAARRRIGYMPEVNKLPAALTPQEILHHHLELFGVAGDRRHMVEAALADVGLSGHAKKRIGHLSKGMARRVAWAQAVIHDPGLLILDEPSSGLDPLGRKEMLGWIEAKKKRGTTIVLCTHEMNQVQLLCDEIHLLRRGRLVVSSLAADGPQDGVVIVGRGRRHVISVSGGDQTRLARLAESAKLPAWDKLTRDGFLAVLSFDQLPAAMAWLTALSAHGFLVTRFGDEAFAAEEELLPYFGGGA